MSADNKVYGLASGGQQVDTMRKQLINNLESTYECPVPLTAQQQVGCTKYPPLALDVISPCRET